MKCIFILPNLGAGGAERVVTLLAKEFVKMGIKVDIVLLLDDAIHYEIPLGVNVIPLNTAPLSKLNRIKLLREYVKKQTTGREKLVAIPFHDTCLKSVLCATFGMRITTIACERNNPYIKGTSFLKKLLANIPFVLATKCVFQTIDAMEYYSKMVRKKSTIIENPLSLNSEYKWKGQGTKRILSIGRLEEQKNQTLLIDAFREIHQEHPDYKLDIYGEGSLKSSLLDLISRYELDKYVTLKGHTKEVHKELEMSEIFVLPSDYEGMSNALLEAMAIGVPVVSTDHPIGGAKAVIINGENGLLTEVRSKKQLVDAIQKIIDNPALAREMSVNARKISDKLSSKEIAEKWKTFIMR